jgi:hypothetical protein
MSRPFRALSLALIVAVVAAAAIAAGGSARNANVTFDAKLAPNVVTGGEAVNYKSSFTNNKSATTHLVFTAEFPTGTTDISAVPATCTTAGLLVTCDFGQVAAGVKSTVELKATTPAVSGRTSFPVDAEWGFFDVKGQSGSAQSTDHFPVSRSIESYPAADGSVSGKCLTNAGGNRGVAAAKDGSSIVMQTPDFNTGLCVPVAVQVVTAGKLMSFGPLFGSSAPASLVLAFAGKKKADPLTYTPDVGPSFVVRPCSETPITTVAACETGERKLSDKAVLVSVLWIGDDPFWNM